MEYTNRHILDRMMHYGLGSRPECTTLLGQVTLCILDVLDELQKGDNLHLAHVGSIGVQLEPQVWMYMPMRRLKFCRSRQTRWLYVFSPSQPMKLDRLRRFPDVVHPPFNPTARKPEAPAPVPPLDTQDPPSSICAPSLTS